MLTSSSSIQSLADGVSPEHQQAVLIELVRVDMERRWREAHGKDTHTAASPDHGLPRFPRVEDYLRCFPAIQADDAVLVDLAADEFRVRRRWGDQPTVQGFVDRFPQMPNLANVLREVERDVAVEAPSANGLDGAHVDTKSSDDRTMVEGWGPESSSQAATNSPDESRVLGDYRLIRQLGEGGMGTVYLAEHIRLRSQRAVKLLAERLVNHPDAIARFHREMEVAGRLTHPNVVTTHDARESNGTHYLVMEYVEGQDLSQLVKEQGPLSPDRAIDCIQQAAAALEYAHAAGVVHRDIKPSNFLLAKDGTVKLLDLGLARLSEAVNFTPDNGLTNTGSIMGTVDYMAPEQAMDTKSADERSDIYSLGCTLFFLLTGRPAYEGTSVTQKLIAHREQPIPDLAGEIEKVPVQLQAVFQRMISKQPEQRFQSMAELLAALESLRIDGGKTSRPAVAGASSAGHQPRPRSPRLVLAGAATLLVAVAAIAWFAFNGNDSEDMVDVSSKSVTPPPPKKPVTGVSLAGTLQGHPGGYVSAVAFSGDGRWLATGGTDGVVWLHELKSQTGLKSAADPRQLAGATGVIEDLRFSPDHQQLAAAIKSEANDLVLWDLAGKARVIEAGARSYFAVDWSADGETIYAGDFGRIAVYRNLGRKRATRTYIDVSDDPKAPAFTTLRISPNGQHIAAGCLGTFAVSSTTASDKPVKRLDLDHVTALAWLSDDEVLVGTHGSVLHIVPLAGEVKSYNTQGRSDLSWAQYSNIALDPFSTAIATAGHTNIQFGLLAPVDEWTGDKPALVQAVGTTSRIESLAFSPDGETLVTGALDGTVQRWTVERD